MGKKRKDPYISKNFLLGSEAAEELYHEWARDLPVIDYRCRLPPEDMADDRKFKNLSEVWLAEDRDKWRAMRLNGISERCITGDASDWDKFQAWANTMPRCLGSPLYHLSHIELKRPFRIGDMLLNQDTAAAIWEECNERLDEPGYTARGLMEQAQVLVACTSNDPCDNLEPHRRMARQGWHVQVRPTWHSDKTLDIEHADTFNNWIDRLGVVSGIEISDTDALLVALRKRHDAFHNAGCRMSERNCDLSWFRDSSAAQVKQAFSRARAGKQTGGDDAAQFKSWMLLELARMDHARGWVQQIHVGSFRDGNSRMFRMLGTDAGFDFIGSQDVVLPLLRLLDALDLTDQLAKTLITVADPRGSSALDTLITNFHDGAHPGKLQVGPCWSFPGSKDCWEALVGSRLGLSLPALSI
ncbi:MAG: glucuronate isomerase, partial [Planctomycetota bacterium]